MSSDLYRQAMLCITGIRAGMLTWDDFEDRFAGARDPLIAQVVRLLRLEPEEATPAEYQEYRAVLERALLRLEAAAGTL